MWLQARFSARRSLFENVRLPLHDPPAVPRGLRAAARSGRRPGPAGPLLLVGLCLAALDGRLGDRRVRARGARQRRRAARPRRRRWTSRAHQRRRRTPAAPAQTALFTIWGLAWCSFAIAPRAPARRAGRRHDHGARAAERGAPQAAAGQPHAAGRLTQIGAASFPSGHSTAAAVLAAARCSSRRRR